MKMECLDNQIKSIASCFFVYFLLSMPVILVTLNFLHAMMIWNLFLSILPLIFAWLLLRNYGKSRAKTIVFGFLWLFFFPNAPYMITDFIHISGVTFYSKANAYAPAVYSTDIITWIRLVHIGTGVLSGTLAGLLSLYIIHQMLLKSKRNAAANSLVAIACLLSGYAIYIGRFLRFNSWDILRPLYLLPELANNMNLFTLKFSLLFALYVLVIYCMFYAIYHNKYQGHDEG